MKKKIINIILISILILTISIIYIKLLDIVKFKCLYKELFNIYCPGCGSTRMIKALINLEIYQAFRYNPLIFISIIITIIYIIYNAILYLKGKKLQIPSKKTIICIIILLLIYMILRNIPIFDFLIPTKIN